MITLIEEDRQVFRLGAEGLPEPIATQRETPLPYSFCRHVGADEEPVVVPDVRGSPRLAVRPRHGAPRLDARVGEAPDRLACRP